MKDDFNTNADRSEAERFDPVSLMFKDRIIMVAGEVNAQMTYNITSQLKKLEFMDPTKEIIMVINSPGGSVVDGMAILDTMRSIKCPIQTVGNGMQASMGSILLAGGDIRSMSKNSMLLIHQIMGGAQSGTQHTDFNISAAFMSQQHEKLKSVYVEFTGLNHKFWDIVGERDSWLTAEQAEKIGFINGVTEDKKAGGKYAAEAVRAPDEGTLQYKIDTVIKEHIAGMSADQIARVINSGNAEGGIYAQHRGELIVRLSEFPEFWTEGKKLENGVKVSESSVSNDNSASKISSSKKKSGPSNS